MDKHRARLAFFVLAIVVSSAASVALPDDSATVMKRLRPDQRTYVIFANRHGDPRAIAYSGDFRIAVAGKYTQPEALAYVPTTTYAKPNVLPTPRVEKHDLTWMFEHRFVQPASDDDRVPGVPARSEVASPFDIDSGAFHGVRTLNGWSAERVTVSIPCGVSHFTKGAIDEETGYIYIGGWGAGANGVSVDAGLQKSSAQSGGDDYAFYFKYATNKPITSDMRFPCGGPDVTLELYPVTQSLLVFTATGVKADGKRVTLTMVQKTLPKDGWTPSGGSTSDGIILKRIVAIAQPYSWHHNARHRNRFADGSYFGVKSPTDRKPRIVFKSCEIGHVTPPSIMPRYAAWALPETWSAAVPGMYLDWPPLGVTRQTSGVCDAAGIYLHAV